MIDALRRPPAAPKSWAPACSLRRSARSETHKALRDACARQKGVGRAIGWCRPTVVIYGHQVIWEVDLHGARRRVL